jgi:hypothetical protein
MRRLSGSTLSRSKGNGPARAAPHIHPFGERPFRIAICPAVQAQRIRITMFENPNIASANLSSLGTLTSTRGNIMRLARRGQGAEGIS